MARACGSYPQCRGFKSLLRYSSSLARWSSGQDATLSRSNQGFDSLTGHYRLSNRIGKNYGSLAQLGEHLPYKQRVTGSSPVTSIFLFLENIARKIEVFCMD